CLAMPEPATAIARLEQGYLYQRYAAKPSAAEVSAVSTGIIESVLGEFGGELLATHPRIHSHIVTARGKGLTGHASGAGLAAGMGAAALRNMLGRTKLERAFQRVIFHSGAAPAHDFRFDDFETCHASIAAADVKRALAASGAITFVLAGERDIPNAPSGHYWDGGIIDYHFDLTRYHGDGLLLYPHFSATVITGWFDKFLPWRKSLFDNIDKLVLLCPSNEFIASLPHGKIPDRSDFQKMRDDDRIRYWEECVARSREVAEDFVALVEGADPLAGATVFA
ncbi:MAG: patatin-like phospholipase family protein, partial [Halioglobus sp.]|nr:patatin-like phospholipase family protein [Halioglobus sp.]